MATNKHASNVLTRVQRQSDVAIFAVHELGGSSRFVDTEDVAMKCQELAPEAFSWRKYPQQVNLELVRVVLSNAKKAQHGGLLRGTGTQGWRLTAKGVAWVHEHANLKRTSGGSRLLAIPERRAGSADSRRADREISRLKSSRAWSLWQNGEAIPETDVKHLFRVDDYATTEMKDMKIARLRDFASHDPKLSDFIDAVAKTILPQGA